MPEVAYRVFFGDRSATREQLEAIEEITVEQEMDLMWEARMKRPVCLDAQGRWQGQDEDFMRSFARVRVEIKVGKAAFVPLIDGPVTGFDSQKSNEPGRSSITLTVRDDSVFLDRNEAVARFDDLSDSDVARQLLGDVEQIAEVDVDETPPPSRNLPPAVVQRGTAMQLLRRMARRQGMHAYVLPGSAQGRSIGLFKRLSTAPSDLPPLVLLGRARNVEQVNASNDDERPATVQASSVNVDDKDVVSSTSRFDDLDRLGSEFTFDQEDRTAKRLAAPTEGSAVDLDRRVAGEAERDSFAFQISGRAIPDCYAGVLRPYLVVKVDGLHGKSSGNFLIRRVTHTLTRSTYTQSFTMTRNARSPRVGKAVMNAIDKIF